MGTDVSLGGTAGAKPEITTAADWREPDIRTPAPLYALDSSFPLLRDREIDRTKPFPRDLRFRRNQEARVLDAETGARWDPFPLGPDLAHWGYGQVTMEPRRAGEYFFDYLFDDDVFDLIPEIFVAGELVVNERVRDLIEGFAPGFCYFPPLSITGLKNGKPTKEPLFKVFIRREFSYYGPEPQRLHTLPWKKFHRRNLFPKEAWSALCNTEAAKTLAYELPIFIFNVRTQYPVLNAALFSLLKRHNVTGLLETTLYGGDDQIRPDTHYEFETVYAVDPDYHLKQVTQ